MNCWMPGGPGASIAAVGLSRPSRVSSTVVNLPISHSPHSPPLPRCAACAEPAVGSFHPPAALKDQAVSPFLTTQQEKSSFSELFYQPYYLLPLCCKPAAPVATWTIPQGCPVAWCALCWLVYVLTFNKPHWENSFTFNFADESSSVWKHVLYIFKKKCNCII